jgi:hypothetical protein
MTAQEEERMRQLEQKVADLEAKIKPWSNVQFSAESGGGDVSVGPDNVILRPFASTPAGSQ